MSGGARNERRRKQEAAQARLAAAGITVPKSALETNRIPLIIVAVVVALAVAVAGGLYYLNSRPVTPTYGVTVAGAVVTAGSGPVEVDLYEDFLCPGCLALEKRDGNALTTALNENKVTVKFHMLGYLDTRSNPAGYSTRAADASLCAATAGIYGAYRQKLFDQQPAENSAGLTDAQLVTIGTDLGATGDFAGCVNGTTHDAAIKTDTDAARNDDKLKTNGTFATPTIVVKGNKVDINDANWLTSAIGG